ncbi:MAG: peptidoglycan-binding protein, partial [Pseudomonadota bacterium]
PLYGHVGIIETVHGDGTFTVVNGNVSNEVRRSRFKAASVLPEGLRWPAGSVPPAAAGAVADAPLGSRRLSLGSRGADVEALQRDLNLLSYQLEEDGIFGGRTRDAVQRFARRRGLDADGIADAAILAALDEAVAARSSAKERRRAGQAAAAPVAGAGALATVGVGVGAAVDALTKIKSLDDGTIFGGMLAAALIIVLGGFFVWRFALNRAEGPILEERP